MSIFNFGNKQRLHTQLYGNTSGKELFKVDDYNNRKKTTGILIFFITGFLTLFYFCIQAIPTKILTFLIITTIGLSIWLYFNIKQQIRLREVLY